MHDSAVTTSDIQVANDWASKSVPEIAQLIGISERYAWKLVSTGELPSFKLGTRRFVRRTDLNEFLDDLVTETRNLRERVGQSSR